MAFATDSFLVYEQFMAGHLHSGDSLPFSGMTELALICTFVVGLLNYMKQPQASSKMDDMSISQIMARPTEILKDDHSGVGVTVLAVDGPEKSTELRCHGVNKLNYKSIFCLLDRDLKIERKGLIEMLGNFFWVSEVMPFVMGLPQKRG